MSIGAKLDRIIPAGVLFKTITMRREHQITPDSPYKSLLGEMLSDNLEFL